MAKIANTHKNTSIFMKSRICYFWDAQNHEKNEIVLRQARKVVGPKAPGAHRAHGPRPLGPIGPIRSHAVAWVRDRPGPSNCMAASSCMAAYGPYGSQGPWTMGPMGPRGLGPNPFSTVSPCLPGVFFRQKRRQTTKTRISTKIGVFLRK